MEVEGNRKLVIALQEFLHHGLEIVAIRPGRGMSAPFSSSRPEASLRGSIGRLRACENGCSNARQETMVERLFVCC